MTDRHDQAETDAVAAPGDIRLTEWTSCGGCAAKWGASLLAGLVDEVATGAAPDGLLIGLSPFDDAAVYRLSDDLALVSTTDFFPPLVDDPADFGAVAAANACSDIFAMGARVVLALNVSAFPEHLPVSAISAVLSAAAAVVADAGGVVAGGHTIRSDEPIFGLAVQGLVHPDRILTKGGARPGDALVLSKPLGTGIVLAGGSESDKAAAVLGMRALNRRASESLCARGAGVHAVTDVTGFGLLGHGWEMAERSGATLAFAAALLPLYPGAAAAAGAGVRTGGDPRNRDYLAGHVEVTAPAAVEALAYDPQTSGGLLAAVDRRALPGLTAAGFTEIGRVEDGPARVRPGVSPERPPSIDRLAGSLADIDLPHPLLVEAARQAVAAGDPDSARARALALQDTLLRPVVNATGVLLHTNLGRSPVAVHHPARYQSLELDLATGRRGSRSGHAAALIARATGAEAALVVNNGAAAVLLVLAATAVGRRVLISRGELVEIGGGFRIPEVLASAGVELVEVGTTNRTRLDDYRQALDDDTALILKVHQSNYAIVGFTESVGPADLAGLGPPVVYDIGSGLLDAGAPWLTRGTPTVAPERAGGASDAGPGGRAGDLLDRQALRRPAGWGDRRPGRPGRRLRSPPPRPGLAPGGPRARGPAGDGPGLPAGGGWGHRLLEDGHGRARRAGRSGQGRRGGRGGLDHRRGRRGFPARPRPSLGRGGRPRRRHRPPASPGRAGDRPGAAAAAPSATCERSTPPTTLLVAAALGEATGLT